MKDDAARPQINVSKLVVGGGVIGAIFAVGSMSIFLIGIPILRVMLPAAIVLGGGVALILHFKRHETPGAPWIIAASDKKMESQRQVTATDSSPRDSSPRTLRVGRTVIATS
jgi:hypothetical protein